MNSKPNSTIAAKPAIDPALQWIGGMPETPEKPAGIQDNKKTSKQNNKNTDADESEPTAMLSARVPVSLTRKLRIRAATEGRTIQEIVTELLENYLGQD